MLHRRPPFLRPFSFVLFLCSAGGLASLAGCESGDASVAPYYHRVQAVKLEAQQSYEVRRLFVGTVQSRQRTDLGFELSGTLAALLVNEGAKVRAGQPLAQLDTRLLQAELREIAAQREELQARHTLAAQEMGRQRELIRQGFASVQRLDELEAQLATLDAQLKQQQSLASSAQTRLEKHTLLAPYDGEIALRYADLGAVTVAGAPVLQLLESGVPQARVGVPAHLASSLIVGAELMVVERDRQLTAVVDAVNRNVDPLTLTAQVRLRLPETESWTDGEMLYLALPERVDGLGYWVPDSALSSGARGLWNVLALVDDKGADTDGDSLSLEARSVEVLYMADGRAFVRGALADGEHIVGTGVHRLVPGQRVRIGDGQTP